MMFKVLIVLLFIHKQCVYGVPLEGPTDNLSRFFNFSPHVVGGIPAPQDYAPHMAALVAGEGFTIIACGGSIVQPNLILTAARCIELFVVPGGLLESFHAVVGGTNWHSQGSAVQFINYHIHPQWDSRWDKNDIGFLVLEKKLVLSNTVKVMPLNFDWVGADEASYIAGWGSITNVGMQLSPFHLHVLNVTTISSRRCVDEVREFGIWWGGAPYIDPSVEICTFDSFGKGLCFGDAGTPLISRKSGTQIGIASWAFTCALGVPDMYTRISAFQDYIQDIMKQYQ